MSARLSGKIKNEKRPSKKRSGTAAWWYSPPTYIIIYGKNNKSPDGERAYFSSRFTFLSCTHHPSHLRCTQHFSPFPSLVHPPPTFPILRNSERAATHSSVLPFPHRSLPPTGEFIPLFGTIFPSPGVSLQQHLKG